MAATLLPIRIWNYNPVKRLSPGRKRICEDAASATENMASSISSGKIEAKDKRPWSDNTEITGKIMIVAEKGELHIIQKDNPDKPVVITPANCIKFSIDTSDYLVVKNATGG